MFDDYELPIPVGALIAVAVVGLVFIGLAIAICCYFCVPRGHKLRRLFDKSRTAPSDLDAQDENACVRCCRGANHASPWRGGYSPTPSERARGVMLVDPYVIEIGTNPYIIAPRQKSSEDCCQKCCYPCCPPPNPATPRRVITRPPPPVRAALPPDPIVAPTESLMFTRLLRDTTLSKYPTKVVLECELNRPNVNVNWTRNGFPIDRRRAKVEANGRVHRLILDRCDPNDEGSYECSVVPLPNRETSDLLKTTGRVDIKIPPTLLLDKYLKKVTEVKVGQTVYFHLPFTGHPRPRITARFSGNKPLPDATRMTIDDVGRDQIAIFTISDSIRSDSGTYLITAENDSGTVVGELLLSVKDRPSVPRDFNASETLPSSCKLNWLRPSDDGGSPVEGFVIERKQPGSNDNVKPSDQNWQPVGRFSPETLQAIFSDLKANNQFLFRIAAFNKYGVSDWATLGLTAKQGIDVPGKPQPPNVGEASKTRCRVNWIPPLIDGGSPITKYTIECAEAGTNKWLPVPRQPASTLPPLTLLVQNLAENKKYQFRVAAENKAGLGPFSEPSRPISARDQFTVPSKPNPPQVNDIFKDKCRVDWHPPASDGGAPITGYVLERSPLGTDKWKPLPKPSPSTLPLPLTLPVSDLVENGKYQFRVAAENKAGRGPFSDPSVPVAAKDPWEPPGKPLPPNVSDIAKSKCRVKWVPPADDGGAPITNYLLERAKAGANKWDPIPGPFPTAPTQLTAPVTNLDENNNYQFRVAAENRAGRGPFSDPSEPIKPVDPSTAPGIPGRPTVTDVTDNSCKVHWTPPLSNGGEPISDYIVESTPANKPNAKPKESPVGNPKLDHTVANLKPGEDYKFQVRAVNKIGKGDPSEPSQPVRIPLPPPPPPKEAPKQILPAPQAKAQEKLKETPKPAEKPKEAPKQVLPQQPKREEKTDELPKPAEKAKEPPKPAEKLKEAPKQVLLPQPRREEKPPKEAPKPAEKAKEPPKQAEKPKEAPKQVPPPQPKREEKPPKEAPKPAEKAKEPPKQAEKPKEAPKQVPLPQPKREEKPREPPKPAEKLKEPPKPAEKPKEPPKQVPAPQPKQAEKPKEPPKQVPAPQPKQAEKPKEPPKQAEKPKEPPKQAEKPKEPPKQVPAPQPKQAEKPKEAPKQVLPAPQSKPAPKEAKPNATSLSVPTPTPKRVTFAETPRKRPTNEWDMQPRTPPPKKPKTDRLDRLNDDKPEFNMRFGMALNSINRHDITRKVTQF